MHILHYYNTFDIFRNSVYANVVGQDARFGDSQMPNLEHLLIAIAPLGLLGHDTLAVLFAAVSGHSNNPRSPSVVLALQTKKTKKSNKNHFSMKNNNYGISTVCKSVCISILHNTAYLTFQEE